MVKKVTSLQERMEERLEHLNLLKQEQKYELLRLHKQHMLATKDYDV